MSEARKVKHGSRWSALAGLCTEGVDGKPCALCLEASAAYMREYRAPKQWVRGKTPKHGTLARSKRCTCERCLAAKRKYDRDAKRKNGKG